MSAVTFACQGRLSDLDEAARQRLLQRRRQPHPEVAATVRGIIDDVAQRGDEALRDLAERFDGVRPAALEVPRERWRQALRRIPTDLFEALDIARTRIGYFHHDQLPVASELEVGEGIRLGRRPEPLHTVGAYAPGGRAAYPSSVLMCVMPARLAGVQQIVVCSPPQAGAPDGMPPDAVLAACELADADRLFAIGGAGAVAALAFGTATVPRADKVVGPGNAWVTEAKRQLAGQLASDCLAGPSELLVVADASADAATIAREMAAQAEHDPESVVAALLCDEALLPRVRAELDRRVPEQPRADTIREALARNGALLLADDRETALDFASEFAPEHLLLLVHAPGEAMERVRGAGSIFLGPHSSVVFGDYSSGTNHVLPTGGQSRSASGLSVSDFIRWSSWQQIDARGAAALAALTALIADAEGLAAHAAAARALGDGQPPGDARPPLRRRSDYASLRTYDPGRSPVEIDLSDNTNLFGQAPSAVRVLDELQADGVRRYPSLYGGELKQAAARYFGVGQDNIATGCGSDDLLDATIRAFRDPSDVLVYPRPTFSMIESFARMNGVRPVGVECGAAFELDVDAMAGAAAQITYVCRPNNPTGNACARSAIETLARRAAGLLVVDEAYGDFCAEPLAAWATQTDRVVVLRTLSKAFGLAGLRVGIAVGPAELIAEIEKARGPYKVSVPAEAAAAAALRQDGAWIEATVAQAVAMRERLAHRLAGLGLRAWPSDANFLLVGAPGNDAAGFAAGLRDAGIGVRPFPALPQAGDCVRITVGPEPLMDRLLQRTEELLRA